MPPKPGLLTVLRNRDFLALWLSQVLSQLADKIYLVLTIAIITDYFQRPGESINGWVGAVMVVFTIPAVFLGSVAGVYVDRWQKRTVLMATNLLRGLLILALPAGLWVGQALLGPAGGFIALLITTFAVSTLTQFFAPAEQAAIPLIIPAGQLISANSLYTTSMMGALIIGFAVGEPLLALANHLLPGQNGPEWVVATAYLLAGFTILGVRTGEKPHPRHAEPLHVWQDLREGFSLLQKQPRLRVAVVLLVILFSVFAALAFLAVRLAEVMPELNTAQFGYLLAVAGLGMGVGAAILSQNHREPQGSTLYRLGFLGMAICLLGMANTTQQLAPTLVFIFGVGLCGALIGVPLQTRLQAETPEDMRGKVFGLQNNAVNIALSLPLVLTGAIESWLGLPVTLMGLAGLVFVSSWLSF